MEEGREKNVMKEMTKLLKEDNFLDLDMFDPKYLKNLLNLGSMKGINLKEKKDKTTKDKIRKKNVKKSRKKNRRK